MLVGAGRACFESLRPLAYSLLAEIVHHVRGDLWLPQVLIVMSFNFAQNDRIGILSSVRRGFIMLVLCFLLKLMIL